MICPASQRSPGAHRGLQGASGSRLTPPKKRHLSVLDVACLRDFFLFHVGGVLVSQSDNQRKMGRSETMRGSPSSGRSLPRAFRPGRCPSVRPAQGQILGVRVPGPGSRRSRSSIPAWVPVPIPPCLLPKRSPAHTGQVSGHSRPRLKIGGHLTID